MGWKSMDHDSPDYVRNLDGMGTRLLPISTSASISAIVLHHVWDCLPEPR